MIGSTLQLRPGLILNNLSYFLSSRFQLSPGPLGFAFLSWNGMPNFRFCVSWISSQDSSNVEENQTNQTKPKINQTEPYKKPPGLSYYCEVSLNAKFLLPLLYVSCFSTQYSSFSKKKILAKIFVGKNFLLWKFF